MIIKTAFVGIKGTGMKTAFAAASTSIVAFFSKVLLGDVHPALGNASAFIGLLSGVFALTLMIVNIRKGMVETELVTAESIRKAAQYEVWLLEHCERCKGMGDCKFPEHRPPGCKFSTPTTAIDKGTP